MFIVESDGTLTHSASITYECGWRQTYDVHPTQLKVAGQVFLLLKTGGKRSVISNHFFELFLKITEIEMLPIISLFFLLLKIVI